MNKQIKVLAILVMFLVSMLPMAMAADEHEDFEITKIEVDGFEMNLDGDTFGPVYTGEELKIKVFWLGINDSTEAKITVELADAEEETDYFTVRNEWEGSETLYLDLDPDVFDTEEDNMYRLHIEMEDEQGHKLEVENIMIEVSNQRHSIELYDVNFPNGREVTAGSIFQANVGVKNLGHSREEDVKITLSIPELGISTRTDRFDLWTEEEFFDDGNDDDDFHYKLHRSLFLAIPLNTISGVYDVDVEVSYNDGDDVVEKTYSLIVSSGVAPSDAVISIDSTNQDVTRGQGAVYKIMFANLGNQAGTYTVDVSGVSGWGTARVDPKTVTVGPDDTAEMYIFVSADEGAGLGSQSFTAKVMTGGATVKEFSLNANVVSSTSADVMSVKEGLQIGFMIVLVILVILAIILVAKKLGKDSSEEEPFIEEDQTYY